jgi:hypothetical protein
MEPVRSFRIRDGIRARLIQARTSATFHLRFQPSAGDPGT